MKNVVRSVADRAVWLDAARAILVEQGIDAVKVEPLAAMLEISRSSFYWHFVNRQDLLDGLIQHWMDSNDAALSTIFQDPESDPKNAGELAKARFAQLNNLFANEDHFSSDFDIAVREWARRDTKIARQVAHVDRRRISHLQRIFSDMGHSKPDSMVRARLLYFHQLGYYLTGIKENESVRQRVATKYLELLSGIKV